jgi:hypothetical protein
MTLIYKTREGELWTVKNCRRHQELPDFFIGERHTDGKTVTVHRHRSEPSPEPTQQPLENANAS